MQREQWVDTDPLLGVARQQLRCAVSRRPPCRGGRSVGPKNVTAIDFAPPANFLGSPPFEAEQSFVPSPLAPHLEQQRVAPKSLLLATTNSPRFVGAQPLRLVVPRRWPRLHQKAPPHPHPQKYPCFSGEFQTLGFSNTSFSWCQRCSVLVSVASVVLSVGTATVPKLTTRSAPPNQMSSVRRCQSTARSRRSTPESCASGVRRHLRGDPSPASSRP